MRIKKCELKNKRQMSAKYQKQYLKKFRKKEKDFKPDNL